MWDEKLSIVISIVVLALLYSFKNIAVFPKYAGIFALLVLAGVFAKKIAGYFLEINAKVSIWGLKQYGIYEVNSFKKPVPIGIILPLFLAFFTFGSLKWLGMMQTDFKEKITKQIRKKKFKSFSEIRDVELAIICFSGVISSLAIALLALPFSAEVAKIGIAYAFFNLLPIGKLDGTNLFFGSRGLYITAIIIFLAVSAIFGLSAL